jgi:protein-glutamine gamma-glutamyltransferase
MKTPPFLLGAALFFWGWQTGFPVAGAVMAVALESAGWIKARWEVSDEDLSRIWTFCCLLLLTAAVYAFSANEGPANFSGFFQQPNLHTERNASLTSARTAAALIRWLPMIFFLFIAAQAFSPRVGIPIRTISLILRRRCKKARKQGQPSPAGRTVNVSYPYFALCLFAASVRAGENNTYFWGLCVLLAWALWSQRSKRFGVPVWIAAVGVAIALGFFGQDGLGHLQHYLERFDPQWLSNLTHRRFDPTQSKTALGQIGRIKTSAKIVIRVEPKGGSAPPALLREASYRSYKARVWDAASSKYDFEDVRPENNTTYLLLRGKTNTATVNIACYLHGGQGLLPLPAGSGRLDNLLVMSLQKNSAGTVLAGGPGLAMFDARFGPGAAMDSSPNTNEDCSVYPKEIPALEQIISELQLTNQRQSLEQVLGTLNGFFQGKFSYSTWQETDRLTNTNETPVSRFLLRTRSGHCEYFATATVLLLRQLNIPSRYAVGYAVHERSGLKFIVRQRDAHAWCLVWNANKAIWQDFDTTPASWVEAETRASPLQFLWDAWSRMVFEISKLRLGQTHLRQYILWALAPVLAVLLYQIIFRSRRQRRRRNQQDSRTLAAWPGLDSEFYQLEKKLLARGVARQSSETFSSWLFRAAADPALVQLEAPLKGLLRLHYRYRFDPQGLTPADREQLRLEAQACLARLTATQ